MRRDADIEVRRFLMALCVAGLAVAGTAAAWAIGHALLEAPVVVGVASVAVLTVVVYIVDRLTE